MSDGRIELVGGWAFVRCDDPDSVHYHHWFLEEPGEVWVAKFWDGPEAGEEDAHAFANALRASLRSSHG